ncbi:MAG: enoyl-CoA hydratase-related protein [Dehalococcoidia bacterium]
MRDDYETIRVAVDDGIVTLTLNRPEKMNAMSPLMLREITEVLDEVAWDEEMRVLVITGAGAAFSSGMDLDWARRDGPNASLNGVRAYYEYVIGVQEKLRLFSRPTIAAVNGWALATGFWLAMLCDCVVVADDARLGVPQMRHLGHPAGGSLTAMVHFVPHRFALYHLMTGEDITGKDAERYLMVNKSVPKEQVLDEAYALARRMKQLDPIAARFVKRSYWRAKHLPYSGETVELEIMEGAQVNTMRAAAGLGRRDWKEESRRSRD